MTGKNFTFDLYRLNIVDDVSQLPSVGSVITGDDAITKVLTHVTSAKFDEAESTLTTKFRWHCREFDESKIDGGSVVRLILARSTTQQLGQSISDDGLHESEISHDPPPALHVSLLFHLRRHLVAVEHNAALMNTQRWRTHLHAMLDRAAWDLEFRSSIRLEPVPRDEEIIQAFLSFSCLTRLRLRLRIANPELSRYAKHIQEEMKDSGIRDYLQDMRSSTGISQAKEKLPYASAELAQSGYKEGEVLMEGERGGKHVKVTTGKTAARGTVHAPDMKDIKQYVRGAAALAKTKEGQQITTSILEEIDRIAPPPMDDVT